jgi:Flp pilus assembly protein TadG
MTTFARFRDDCRGTTAVVFGVLLLPIMICAGASLDYLRAANMRTAMQAAADAAALAAARDASTMSSAQLVERAKAVFTANFAVRDGTLGAVSVHKGDRAIRVEATGSVKTTIMGILNIDTIPVGTSAEVAWGKNKIELALVLDNTGSMAEAGKMPALKVAVRDFLTTLEGTAYRDSVKVSIIPFDTQVNIGTRYIDANWLTFDADLPRAQRVNEREWRGCVSDRSMPYDTRGDGGSSHDTRYPAAKCSDSALLQIQTLTSNFRDLRRTIDAMQPSGFTNITIGTVWGLASLNAGGPIGGGVPRATPGVEKIMVILTDGDNTRNRFTSNARQIDERTRLACKHVKDSGVRVHTVRVIEGNAGLLRECASASGTYHEVRRASELTAVFRKIATDITKIRLTH